MISGQRELHRDGKQYMAHPALTSCAPGISVVNIDNGYGAACAALRISLALAAAQKQAERSE
jgi:NCAIR mutase (PurE)-related protein